MRHKFSARCLANLNCINIHFPHDFGTYMNILFNFLLLLVKRSYRSPILLNIKLGCFTDWHVVQSFLINVFWWLLLNPHLTRASLVYKLNFQITLASSTFKTLCCSWVCSNELGTSYHPWCWGQLTPMSPTYVATNSIMNI